MTPPYLSHRFMPNIAAVLKTEIARLARREMRGELETLKKSGAGYRRDIAVLKKQVRDLERQVKKSTAPRKVATQDAEADSKSLRFSPTRFASQRRKLGLSAANFAKLLGVSALSVYKWESGKTRPRRAQLESIAAVRGLGKREVLAKLDELSS
jgi:DNA-binding transcriptional regulator YiaG